MLASGCVSSPAAPAPTPDPFAGLADRSDQAFREGLEAYGQGQYRAALTAFERARVLSPSGDQKIDQMIERTRGAMAPTPTPVPPTPTSVPATPTVTAAAVSTAAPDVELGARYFGQVLLSVVPSKDGSAVAANQFFFQDQIGLRIDGLKQHLRLPLMLRVFNVDSGRLIAEVRSEDGSNATATPVATAQATATSTTTDFKLARFWDQFVWYHEGGEEPGRYRAELYANGTLTHVFDYTVGTVPMPTPLAVASAPTVEPTATLASTPEPVALPPIVDLPAPKPAPQVAAPVAEKPAPTATPVPPTATPVPTPATAGTTQIGGLPAGVDVNVNDGRAFIADASGVVWSTLPGQTRLRQPITLDRLPVDLVVDQNTGNLFVSGRNQSAVSVLDAGGRPLKTIPLQAAPGDLQLDSDLGLLYVAVPDQQALIVIDTRAGRVLRSVDGLPQITSLALDPIRHTLYVSHLAGQVTSIDVPSSQITGRVAATGPGLMGIATARGLAYAVNTATHELAIVDPAAQVMSRFTINGEPAAVAASEDSGAVYVLASRPNVIVRIDPNDGTEIGRVLLPERSGRFGLQQPGQNSADFLSLRARLVLNRVDETVLATLPEAGALSVVPIDQFPALTYAIAQPELGESASDLGTIPGLLRPAAPALPAQSIMRAQSSAGADQEAH
jgi:hypothetical protein